MQRDPDFVAASIIPIHQALQEVRELTPGPEDPTAKLIHVVEALAMWANKLESKIEEVENEASSVKSDLSDHQEAPARDAHEG
jgi:hypothetical protein